MNTPKIISLVGALFVVAAFIGGLRLSGGTRKQESRILALEREIAMKDLVLADQKARLVEFEQAQEEEAATVKTKAFLEWYNKDIHFY